MKFIGRTQFEYQLCERKNGTKYIGILLYVNDADGYVEVGRINQLKSHWVNQGYGEIEEIYDELKRNEIVADFIAKTHPGIMVKK